MFGGDLGRLKRNSFGRCDGFVLRLWVWHTGWITVVDSTERPKSVRNICVIKCLVASLYNFDLHCLSFRVVCDTTLSDQYGFLYASPVPKILQNWLTVTVALTKVSWYTFMNIFHRTTRVCFAMMPCQPSLRNIIFLWFLFITLLSDLLFRRWLPLVKSGYELQYQRFWQWCEGECELCRGLPW